jgi:hypothetical protein
LTPSLRRRNVTPVRSFARLASAVGAASFFAGCVSTSRLWTPLDDGGASRDLAVARSAVDGAQDATTPATPDLAAADLAGSCRTDDDCPAGAVCDIGIGTCVPGCSANHGCGGLLVCCDTTCVDLRNDLHNCGACGFACSSAHGAPSCGGSHCQITCDPGWGDCDGNIGNGCEADLTTVANCGACGMTCGSQNDSAACTGGHCVLSCNNGFGDCDGNPANGCEANLGSDGANCGTCGHSCGGAACTGGACQQGNGTCASPYVLDPNGGKFTGHMNGSGQYFGSCGGAGVERVHAWTPTRSGTAMINSVTDYWPASLYVWQGGCPGTEIGCQDVVTQWPNFTVTVTVTAGTTYYIVADADYSGPITLTCNLTITPP